MAKVQGKYLDVVLFLFIVALLIMLWGVVGIVGTFYNTFIAESPPYLDYDWAEVMSRQILIFGVGFLILGVSAVIHYIVFLAKQLDYAIYEKDKE
jgi:uncharacterized membrane protein